MWGQSVAHIANVNSSLRRRLLASILAIALSGGSIIPQSRAASREAQYRLLDELLANGSIPSLMVFDPPCFECRRANLSLAQLESLPKKSRTLSAAAGKSVQELLLHRERFLSPDVAKPCGPFVADYGVVVDHQARKVVLLVSRSCQSIRVVGEPELAAGVFELNPNRFAELDQHLRRELAEATR